MKIRFISPWYPDYAAVHSGIFVKKQVEAARMAGHDVTVQVPQVFPAPAGPVPSAVTDGMRRLAAKSVDAMFAVEDGVRYLPTPIPFRSRPMDRARAVAASLALLAEFTDDDPDMLHAHVGLPAGWAVSQVEPNRPLVVTEHWSGLAAALEDSNVAHEYANLVRRADAFIAVSEHLRSQIIAGIGDWAADKVEVIPNMVDISGIEFRTRRPSDIARWIYVGGLEEHKGVREVVRAFDSYRNRYSPDAHLTLVGEGPLRGWIEMYASSHGFASSLDVTGSVEHSRLGHYLDSADVMVHLSPEETFGIASLEGIAAGMPVVSLRNLGAVNTWGRYEELCGTLLELGVSSDEVADAVADLQNSPERLDLAVGRRMIEEKYSPDVIAGEIGAIYERVLT